MVLDNPGDFEHTFTIDDAEIDEVLDPGTRTEVVVVVPDEGSLAFYCRFHVDFGMQGTVTGVSARQSPTTDLPPTTVAPDRSGGYGY
jgi:uncharacterized cupredoxin-like copper-binding protein